LLFQQRAAAMTAALRAQQQDLLGNLGWFGKLIRRDNKAIPEFRDFDLHILESGIFPVLVQGLDALVLHLESLRSGAKGDEGVRARFNPLTWLAQFLVRNHPSFTRDFRSTAYGEVREAALTERGRREIHRRKPQVEAAFMAAERRTEGGKLTLVHMPLFIRQLDELWSLDGAFESKMPESFDAMMPPGHETEAITFEAFWEWFEAYVDRHDILRRDDFERGAKLREQESHMKKQRETEEVERRARQLERAALKESAMKDFESTRRDILDNPTWQRVLKDGAVLTGGVEEDEGSIPVQGNHIPPLRKLFELYNLLAAGTTSNNSWDDTLLACWQEWAEAREIEDYKTGIAREGLEMLTDLGQFKAHLASVQRGAGGKFAVCVIMDNSQDDEERFELECVDDDGAPICFNVTKVMAEEITQALLQGLTPYVRAKGNNAVELILS